MSGDNEGGTSNTRNNLKFSGDAFGLILKIKNKSVKIEDRRKALSDLLEKKGALDKVNESNVKRLIKEIDDICMIKMVLEKVVQALCLKNEAVGEGLLESVSIYFPFYAPIDLILDYVSDEKSKRILTLPYFKYLTWESLKNSSHIFKSKERARPHLNLIEGILKELEDQKCSVSTSVIRTHFYNLSKNPERTEQNESSGSKNTQNIDDEYMCKLDDQKYNNLSKGYKTLSFNIDGHIEEGHTRFREDGRLVSDTQYFVSDSIVKSDKFAKYYIHLRTIVLPSRCLFVYKKKEKKPA